MGLPTNIRLKCLTVTNTLAYYDTALAPGINDTYHNSSLHYAECRYAICHVLLIIMVRVIMLNVIMLCDFAA